MKSPLLKPNNYIIRKPSEKAQGKPVSLEYPVRKGEYMGNLAGQPFSESGSQVSDS